MPTIAAIIPVYNGGRFIEEALQSVLSQTLAADEIIVVDDGSTDDGAEVVRRMAERHPIITLLSKSNGGQSSARNFGVSHAKSDLIAFLDQDDAWYPGHLEMLIRPFRRPSFGAPLGWCYSNLDQVDLEGRMVCRSFLSTLSGKHPKRDIIDCLRQDMFILPSASLIDRRAFDAVGGFDERLSGYEDDDLFLRLFRAGYDNVYIDKPLSRWRIHMGSSSYSPRMYKSAMTYARKLMADFPDEPKHNRYYTRHLVAPRFLPHAASAFVKAAWSFDRARTRSTLSDVYLFRRAMNWKMRAAFTLARPFLAEPVAAWIALGAYKTYAFTRVVLARSP